MRFTGRTPSNAGVACRASAVHRALIRLEITQKKVPPGRRAGTARAEGRSGCLSRGVRRDRPGPTGLRRRERRLDDDGSYSRPSPQRRAGRRPGAARPPEAHHPDRRRAARRRVRLGLTGHQRGDGLDLLRGLRRAMPRPGPATRRHRGHGRPGLPRDGRGGPADRHGRGRGAVSAGLPPGPRPDRADVLQT